MEIVIDTSAVIAVITDELSRPNIIKATRGATLRAPSSVHWEIGNAFSAMLKRKRMAKSKAIKALAIYHDIPIAFSDVALEAALEIVVDFGIYAYDAYLLACAKRFDSPLLTLDASLARVAEAMRIDTVDI